MASKEAQNKEKAISNQSENVEKLWKKNFYRGLRLAPSEEVKRSEKFSTLLAVVILANLNEQGELKFDSFWKSYSRYIDGLKLKEGIKELVLRDMNDNMKPSIEHIVLFHNKKKRKKDLNTLKEVAKYINDMIGKDQDFISKSEHIKIFMENNLFEEEMNVFVKMINGGRRKRTKRKQRRKQTKRKQSKQSKRKKSKRRTKRRTKRTKRRSKQRRKQSRRRRRRR